MSKRLRLLAATLLASAGVLAALVISPSIASASGLQGACSDTQDSGGPPFSLVSTGSLRFEDVNPLALPDGYGGYVSGAASVSYSLNEVVTSTGMKGNLWFRASFDDPNLGRVTFQSNCIDLAEIDYGFIDADFHGTFSGHVYDGLGGSIPGFEDFNYWPGSPSASVLLISAEETPNICDNGVSWWSWGVGSGHSIYPLNVDSWWRDQTECF